MSISLCSYSVESLSVETCILELVNLSLKKQASSIAVRFDPKKFKIQVVDNGIGFTYHELANLFNNNEKENRDSKVSIFDTINSLSKAVIVTSRVVNSSHTYVKIAATNNRCKLFEGYHRPSKGTTVTIYDFNPAKWNDGQDKNCSISYIVAGVAFTELKVSFSLRNDDQNDILLNIKNPHSPHEVLDYVINNKPCELFRQLTIPVLEESEVTCNTNKFCKPGESVNEEYVVSPWSSWSNLLDDVTDIDSPLSVWSNWTYISKNTDNNNSINCQDDKVLSDLNQLKKFDDNFINLSQLSVWSDWSYHPENFNERDDIKDHHNKFIPISIYKILPLKHLKILGDRDVLQSSQYDIFNDSKLTFIEEMFRCYQNVTNFKIYKMKHKFDECRISGNTINSLQILKQVNKEFILAITNENGKKLLIVIDQHAAHERIRYEWLIENYREEKSYKYHSVKLDNDLIISDIDENLLKLIILHRKKLSRIGINIKSVVDSSTCVVDAVPKCFIKRVKNYNNEGNLYRLMKNVRLLLLEIADRLSQKVLPPILPITINNVIATEACHGAIKFGDPLSVKECIVLIEALKDTKAPTRCAHGRPSIIPLLDLSDLEKRKTLVNKKLNFESLKSRVYRKR